MEKIFRYTADHGAIGLTPSKAFMRIFVHWAAVAFDWPGYTDAARRAGIATALQSAGLPP